MRPIIGITPDYSTKATECSLKDNYAKAIASFGGVPIVLPLILSHNDNVYDDFLKLINGLVVSGGNFDIDPKIYGEDDIHPKVVVNQERTEFETKILRKALNKKIPILGICGGMQLINVLLGGSIHQHIPDNVPNALNHQEGLSLVHEIQILEGSKFNKITGKTSILTNSSHHQAIKSLGKDLVASATSSDGLIEVIEHKDYPYCIGVQWHPEYLLTESEALLFNSFIEASNVNKK